MAIPAEQVGSYFVQKYYNALPEVPNLVHQFYSENSIMIRGDGDSTETLSGIREIDALVKSLNFVKTEIKTLSCVHSWDGGMLVMLTGNVKIKNITRRRNFVQTFFLAPQQNGYFVLSDIFHFIDGGVTPPNLAPVSTQKTDAQPQVPPSPAQRTDSDSGWEEASRYVDSILLDGDQAAKHNLLEQQQPHQHLETENGVKETPAQERSTSIPSVAHEDEPLEKEPHVKTYATVLCAPRVQLPVAQRPSYRSSPIPSHLGHSAQPAVQQSSFASMHVPYPRVEAAGEDYGLGEGRGRGRTSHQRYPPRGRFGTRSFGRGCNPDTADYTKRR